MLRLLLLASLCLVGANAGCANNYTEIYGSCYKIYLSSRTYAAAESVCNSDGGYLASIHDDYTDKALMARLPSSQVAWMGLTCKTLTNCTWSDGTPYDFDGFNGGSPVLAYGQCVTLSQTDGNWYSSSCGAQQNAFICKLGANNSTSSFCGDYSQYNGACIKVKGQMRSFADAEEDCAVDGGHLLSLHSAYDNAYIQQLINSALSNASNVEGVLIGLRTDTSHYYYTDGSLYNYANWANFFPNDRFGQCVQILVNSDLGNASQWTNVPCTTRLNYICLRPNAPPPTLAPLTCPSIQMFNDNGKIYSPGFPLSFPANTKCEYLLAGPTGSTISINFPLFGTDNGTTLSIFDGITSTVPIGTLSGAETPNSNFDISSNVMKLVFQTSKTPGGQGWEAQFTNSKYYDTTPTPTTTMTPSTPRTWPTTTSPWITYPTTISGPHCPPTHYYSNATIYSPNYPGAYYPDYICNYYAQNIYGKRITIIFGAIDIVTGRDLISVYDGGSTAGPLLGAITGHLAAGTRTYRSTGAWLTVNFNVHSTSVQGGGWTAQIYNDQ